MYFIRWSSDYTSKEEIAALLPSDSYIISKEYSRRMRLHYHILTQFPFGKDLVQQWFYDNLRHDRKGIPTLKVDVVGPTQEDFDKSAIYTVKDGDFVFSPNYRDSIDRYVAESYQKSEAVGLQIGRLIRELDEVDRPDYKQLFVDIVLIKANAGLEIYPNKISALVLGTMISKDNNVAYELAEKDILFK